jgi:hypothetical protein
MREGRTSSGLPHVLVLLKQFTLIVIGILFEAMKTSFWTRTIEVDVDARTWVRPCRVPPFLQNAEDKCSFDLGQALLMLAR